MRHSIQQLGPIERQPHRRAGWAAIASGIMGLLAFASLIAFFAYLVNLNTEFEKLQDVPLMGRLLLSGNYVGIMVQALLMIPVAVTLHALGRQRLPGVSSTALIMGISAFVAIVVLRALLLLNPEKVSDIWFIGPMGFVGVWLIGVNWLLKGVISRGLAATGTIAGIGLVIAGLSFFLFLDLAALLDNPDAYGENLDFHIGLWIGGIPGLILHPTWAILLGRRLLRERGA